MEREDVLDFLLREYEDGGERAADIFSKCPVEYRNTFEQYCHFMNKMAVYRITDLKNLMTPDIYQKLAANVKIYNIVINNNNPQ